MDKDRLYGNCHCGAVQFSIPRNIDMSAVRRCDCSLCKRQILDEIKTHKPECKKAPKLTLHFKNLLGKMVGVTGIEPVTPTMSTKCSPAYKNIQNIVFICLYFLA